MLSGLTGLVFGTIAFALRVPYVRWLAADAATAQRGLEYLNWFIPALFLQFPLVAMGAALRGMGDVKLPTVIQVGTVLLNIALAPVLRPGFHLRHVWYLSVATVAVQLVVNLWLLHREFGRKLAAIDAPEPQPLPAT